MVPDGPDDDDKKPDKSLSIDVQFSDAKLPAVRRARSKTVPGMIAESLSNLPVVKEVMPKSKRGRVLVRSVVVGFALVATWIAVIVYWQFRDTKVPDFRPKVEAILKDMTEGRADEVYARSSERFQEIVLRQVFVARIADMNSSLGKFREVLSVSKAQMFKGPSGQTARVELLLAFEKEEGDEVVEHKPRANMSFRFEEGEWRMLGFQLQLPDDVAKEATAERRLKERVAAPELRAIVQKILELSRDNKAGEIWDGAASVFKESTSRDDFIALEQRQRERIGPFFRILDVTESTHNPDQTSGSFDALLEFNAEGGATMTVRAELTFVKDRADEQWKLATYRVIMPKLGP